MDDFPQRLGHKTPAWVPTGALFHVRIRVRETGVALTDAAVSGQLMHSAAQYHAQGRWWCELFLLMPDHVHALLRFPAEPGMSRTIREWKRGAARLQRVCWQDNFFDHRVRNAAEGLEKWHYIRRNPVVKGLCACEDEWPHWWAPTRGEEAH